MTTRIVKVGRLRQLITTKWLAGEGTHTPVHEHVTLASPEAMSDTAKLRLLKVNEAGKVIRP